MQPQRSNVIPISTSMWENSVKDIADLKDKINKWPGFGEMDIVCMVTRLAKLERQFEENIKGGYCDRDARLDSGVGMKDHGTFDTDVRIDNGFRMSSGIAMDSGVVKRPDLNVFEDVAMDESSFGSHSGWLNSTSTPQGQFRVFPTPITQVNMARHVQDTLIKPMHNSAIVTQQHADVVMEDIIQEIKPHRIRKKGSKLLDPWTQLPDTTILNPKQRRPMGTKQKIPSMTPEFQAFYNSPDVESSALPYFQNFIVYKGFWDRILCLEDRGYLDDSHIEAFIRLCLFKRPSDANWAAVDTFFTIALLKSDYERVMKYATGQYYYHNWKDCSVVYIPIHDENFNHWYLAVFDIRGAEIHFFDSFEDLNIRDQPHFRSLLDSLTVKLPFILAQIGWFDANNVDPSRYTITFFYPHHVPQQSGLYGDCGPLMLSFMRRMIFGYYFEPVPNTTVYGRECREVLLQEFFEHRLDWVT